MGSVSMTTARTAWLGSLLFCVGCVGDLSLTRNSRSMSDQLATQSTPPETMSDGTTQAQSDGMLELSDLKPGQVIRLVTTSTSDAQQKDASVGKQSASLDFFFSLDKVTGTVVSADDTKVVLRDVIIASERVIDSPKSLGWVPLGFWQPDGVQMERRYTEVPGELMLLQTAIRGAKEVSPDEMQRLVADVAETRPKRVSFDFDFSINSAD